MDEIKWLFRSLVSLFFCVLCVGAGTAIPIVAIAKSAGENVHTASIIGLALSLFGGYLVLLVSPLRGNIKLSGSFGGMSIEMSKEAEKEAPKSTARKIFGSLALLCASILCVGGGIGVAIVALARGVEGAIYVPMLTGIFQIFFGGYLAMAAVDARPWVKASGNLQEGIAIELKEK